MGHTNKKKKQKVIVINRLLQGSLGRLGSGMHKYFMCVNLKYWRKRMTSVSNICTFVFSFPNADPKIGFFFLFVCQVGRLNKAPRWVQPQSGLLICVSPCFSVANFMSELVIIMGDWILTSVLGSISEGQAALVRPEVSLYICLISLLLDVLGLIVQINLKKFVNVLELNLTLDVRYNNVRRG